MTVLIRIDYITNDNKVMRRGEFPLKRNTPEQAAYEFWQWIKNEHPFACELETVMCDNDDITEKVKELDAAPLD
jgi:hypothetical protein